MIYYDIVVMLKQSNDILMVIMHPHYIDLIATRIVQEKHSKFE